MNANITVIRPEHPSPEAMEELKAAMIELLDAKRKKDEEAAKKSEVK